MSLFLGDTLKYFGVKCNDVCNLSMDHKRERLSKCGNMLTTGHNLVRGIWVVVYCTGLKFIKMLEEKRMLRGWGNIRCMGRHSNIFKVLFSFCQSSYRGHLGSAYTASIHTSFG